MPGALYLVSGTRAEDALPSTARRWTNDATEAVVSLYARLSWDFFFALWLWLWTLLGSLASASVAFITSMVVAPDPARAQQQRRQPAPPVVGEAPPPLQ